MKPVKIAIDAMGGDHAPQAIIDGAFLGAADGGTEIILVGNEPILTRMLARHPAQGTLGSNISVIHAPETVSMDESPASVIRKKQTSSIYVANEWVKRLEAQAVISAGNTGASMACSLFVLGPLVGVDRPAVASPFPTLVGTSILIDAGANVDCKPHHLVQFAMMGSSYACKMWGIPRPKVGLLNIGEEEQKGNELTKEVFSLLKKSALHFIGNIEGRDLHTGRADVVVCDGFVGNIALKTYEGVAEGVVQLLKKEIMATPGRKLATIFLSSAFDAFQKKLDYAEYGGSLLLGVNGVSVICHGRASDKAIQNAIRVAKESLQHEVNRHIQDQITEQMPLMRGGLLKTAGV